LQEARSCLSAFYARRFGKGRFDFPGRRLVGENGLMLQWRTRQNPDEPESHENQQTTRGCVVCLSETAETPVA
jgi:hypothetical protein